MAEGRDAERPWLLWNVRAWFWLKMFKTLSPVLKHVHDPTNLMQVQDQQHMPRCKPILVFISCIHVLRLWTSSLLMVSWLEQFTIINRVNCCQELTGHPFTISPRAKAQPHPFYIVIPFIMPVNHVLPTLPFAFKDLKRKCKQTSKAEGTARIGALQIFHHAFNKWVNVYSVGLDKKFQFSMWMDGMIEALLCARDILIKPVHSWIIILP